MFNRITRDDIPEDLRARMDAVEDKFRAVTDEGANVLSEIETFLRQKVDREEGISEHEQENAILPVVNLSAGYHPAVVPFEVRGGVNDGKRLIALCVMLADGKTVMPVLQVADFAAIESAEYVGSIDELEVILPEDAEGVGWQKIVSETVEEYIKIHGGER